MGLGYNKAIWNSIDWKRNHTRLITLTKVISNLKDKILKSVL